MLCAVTDKALGASRFIPFIRVGTQLRSLVRNRPWLVDMLVDIYGKDSYLLVPDGNSVNIILRDTAQCADVPMAYMHACLVRRHMRDKGLIDLGM
jgi:hypothetical protein